MQEESVSARVEACFDSMSDGTTKLKETGCMSACAFLSIAVITITSAEQSPRALCSCTRD